MDTDLFFGSGLSLLGHQCLRGCLHQFWRFINASPLTSPPPSLLMPYGLLDIAQTRFQNSRSLWQGQRSTQDHNHDDAHLHPLNNVPKQVSTTCALQFLRYSPDKILRVKVIAARSKVKSRSHQNVAHLHSPTNVPTKYQLPMPYGFRDIAGTNFSCRPPSCLSECHG